MNTGAKTISTPVALVGSILLLSLAVASASEGASTCDEIVRFEETELTLVGGWFTESDSEYSGGRAVLTNISPPADPGAFALLEFEGTGITWIGAMTFNAGFFDWIIDEGESTERSGRVDTYLDGVDRFTRVLLADDLAQGKHTLKFISVGMNRFGEELPAETYIDAFEVVRSSQACPDGLVQWKISEGGNDHFYEAVFVPDGISWTEARAAARARGPGAHLATINSAEENGFIYTLVLDEKFWPGHAGPWIGGFQPPGSREPDGGWAWVTGEAFNFTSWEAGEPNNTNDSGGSEDFLHYSPYLGDQPVPNPTWNDLENDRDAPVVSYIVEIENNCIEPPPGIVSWWDADSVSGRTALDLINGNDAAMVGGVSIVPGIVGNAFSLDGVDERLEAGTGASLDLRESFSISMWIKPTALGIDKNLFSRGNVDGDAQFFCEARLGQFGNDIHCRFSTDGSVGTEVNSDFVDWVTGDWNHVAVVRDGAAGTVRHYHDGTLVGSGLHSGTLHSSSLPFRIGFLEGDSLPTQFDGLVDEVTVFDRALTSEEIEAIFDAGSAGKCKPEPDRGIIGEVGTLQVHQRQIKKWYKVELEHTYHTPVVVMGPLTIEGKDPAHIRIRNVRGNSFLFKIEEWDYLDGRHMPLEEVSYLVIESGVHKLDNEAIIQARRVTMGGRNKLIPFRRAFKRPPVVLASSLTAKDRTAVVVHLNSVRKDSFRARLRAQESNDNEQGISAHRNEVVGYVAIQEGQGRIGGRQVYEAGLTPRAVNQHGYTIRFNQNFKRVPDFLAQKNTEKEPDPSSLRLRYLDIDSGDVFVEEERSLDEETRHEREQVGYFAIEPPGLIKSELGHFECSGGDVDCLIESILQANENANDNTQLNSIYLDAGVYTLTEISNDVSGANGLPSISGNILIRGEGKDSTIIRRDSAASPFRMLNLEPGGVLTLENVTITGANSTSFGGAVRNSGGTLTVINSTLSHNTAREGGGIFNSPGTVRIIDSTLEANTGAWGGGLRNNRGFVEVLNSTVTGNVAHPGNAGGLLNDSGTMFVLNTTVSGNKAEAGVGGGLENFRGFMALSYCTIVNNSAADGGGVRNASALGTMEATSSIILGNVANSAGASDCRALASLGHNLVGADTGCPADGVGDISILSSEVFSRVLGRLQDNGGPTETHALLPESPAVDAGDISCVDADGKAVNMDQRGKNRPVDGNRDSLSVCDIGAVEFAPDFDTAVGYTLEISNVPPISPNVPEFTLTNDSDPSVDITDFTITIGDNQFNYDIVHPGVLEGTSLTTDMFEFQESDGEVGYELLIFDDFNTPILNLFNNSSISADIIGLSISIGDTAFNYDSAIFMDSSGVPFTLNDPDMEGLGMTRRSDIVDIDFEPGFAPGGFFRFEVDIDQDSVDSGTDYRIVMFNNGSAPNAVIRVEFSNGTVISQTMDDFPFFQVNEPDLVDSELRADAVDLNFPLGFSSGGSFSYLADLDRDPNINETLDYRTILFNNGAAPNSVITVGFSDGTVLTQPIPDAPIQDAYTFTQSSPGSL